jgi:hypothetical protein
MQPNLSTLAVATLTLVACSACDQSSSSRGFPVGSDAVQPSSPTPPIGRATAILSGRDPSLFLVTETAAGPQLLRVSLSTSLDLTASELINIPEAFGERLIGSVTVQDDRFGALLSEDPARRGSLRATLFTPGAARLAESLDEVVLDASDLRSVAAPGGTRDSLGFDLTRIDTHTPVGAVRLDTSRGPELFVAFANSDSETRRSPGCIVVYGLGGVAGARDPQLNGVMVSRSFAPLQLSVTTSSGAPRLLLVSRGFDDPRGATPLMVASVESFDPETLGPVAELLLDPQDSISAVSLRDSGDRVDIAASRAGRAARLYEIDATTLNLTNTIDVPELASDQLSRLDVASSASGNVLYVHARDQGRILSIERRSGRVLESTLTSQARAPAVSGELGMLRQRGDPTSRLLIVSNPLASVGPTHPTRVEALNPTFR